MWLVGNLFKIHPTWYSVGAFFSKMLKKCPIDHFQLDGHNFIVPKQNVATLPMSAYVREGVCRSKNALLNGDTSDYNWDYGYTCHQVWRLTQFYSVSFL